MKKTIVALFFVSLGCLLFGEMTAIWAKLKDVSEFPTSFCSYVWHQMNYSLYDPISNVFYYGIAGAEFDTYAVWKYDLNTNQFTTYPITNSPAHDCSAIAFDSIDNRIIMMDVHDQSTYAVSTTGGSLSSLGGGINNYLMFERNSLLNPLTNNPVIMNGYGGGVDRNAVLEYNIAGGNWITRFPDSSNQPWRRGSASITASSDRKKVYLFCGQGKQDGNPYTSIDPGYIPWGNGFERLRDLWELNLATWTWTPLLINDPSILSEGAICFVPEINTFVFIGSNTDNTNNSYLGGVYTFNPDNGGGFTTINEYGEVPPFNTINHIGAAIYDQINSRIVFIRNDGIWSLNITNSNYDFQASATNGHLPLSTSFQIIPTPPDSASISWDFENDGIIDSNALSPIHTYFTIGTYSVKLRIQNGTEVDSLIKTNYISVNGVPAINVQPEQLSINLNQANPTGNTSFNISNTGLEPLEYSISSTDTSSVNIIPTNGLVAYYPLNGNANDESGNAHHGTALNGLTYAPDRNGILDSSAHFDGTMTILMLEIGNLGDLLVFLFGRIVKLRLMVKEYWAFQTTRMITALYYTLVPRIA